ncbi:uncharacterized protein LOC118165677 [Oxyura jamaicensis]|uniref:uncharacterized protein LOC118165677 n=1 Tax=Oxyura jamaicensis TaxID=8884 RepID=UPI0015A61055|nr:uncharacterized protein LOC118165677 [Oxyura jamaicensis]
MQYFWIRSGTFGQFLQCRVQREPRNWDDQAEQIRQSAADPGDELTSSACSLALPRVPSQSQAQARPQQAPGPANLPSLHAHGQGPTQGALRPFCFLPSSPSPQLPECVCIWWKKCKEQQEAAGHAALPAALGARARPGTGPPPARRSGEPLVLAAVEWPRDELKFWGVSFQNFKRQMYLLHHLHEHRLAAKAVLVEGWLARPTVCCTNF